MNIIPVHHFYLCALVLAIATIAVAATPAPPIDLHKVKVVVCLGDSITDGQTYSLMVAQALREAKLPVPCFFPAGIGGNTAGDMLKRLDRDVLPYHPDLVILNCGINDTNGVKTKEYAANVDAIAARLQQEHVTLLLLTLTTIRFFPQYNEPDATAQTAELLTLGACNPILRRIGEKYGFPVAEVSKVMGDSPRGVDLWAPDGCHLNFEGFRLMSRAILDALGCPDANPPATFADFKLTPEPGLISHWRVHAVTANDAQLDEKTLATLKFDESWKPYTLPETTALPGDANWWWNQERQRGFALQLKEVVGDASRYYACAEVKARKKKQAFVNTGGDLGTIFLNGVRVFNSEYTTGWHAGGHRIPVELKKGVNTIVIATGSRFFFSITDNNTWW